MKQGIIFGILISIFSFTLVYLTFGVSDTTNLDIIIMQDGEEIFSTPLLYSEEVMQIWYVHEENQDIKILIDEEIIEYYDFDLDLQELQDPDNIDYLSIYNVSGVNTEINMIINSGGFVSVIEANCPDKIDVKIGQISDTSKVITCAPHKLVIKLRGDSNNGGGLDG